MYLEASARLTSGAYFASATVRAAYAGAPPAVAIERRRVKRWALPRTTAQPAAVSAAASCRRARRTNGSARVVMAPATTYDVP